MPIRVRAPDGNTVEFPDGTPAQTIERAMRAQYGGPKRGPAAGVAGFMANVNRGLGIGDELAAGAATVGDLLGGAARGQGVNPISAFRDNMAEQRGLEQDFAARRPNVAALGRGIGMAPTAVLPGGPVVQAASRAPRLVAAGRGAVSAGATAAGYTAVDAGTTRERLERASRAARDPLALGLGATLGAAAVRGPKRAPKPKSQVQVLRDKGVFVPPGAAVGGVAKQGEILAKRAPIVGQAIRGAYDRSKDSVNRAAANDALSAINERLPETVKTGFESVQHVKGRLQNTYRTAAQMVPEVAPDDELTMTLNVIGQRRVDLSESAAREFDSILGDRLGRLQGPVTGEKLMGLTDEIEGVAADALKDGDRSQRAMGEMLFDVAGSLKDLLGRTNPEARQMIDQADAGWAAFARIRDAASKSDDGIFSPEALKTSVRTQDRSIGKGAVAQGDAVLQELSNAANVVLKDSFGNPGTADAAGVMALGGLALGDVGTAGLATGALTAAATPYFLMGRNIAARVSTKAGAAELRAAEAELADLARRDPSVEALRVQIAQRLARLSGVGASQERP